jgi:hypothetical protein
MAEKRTVICDICGASCTEESYGAGWPGWMGLKGVKLNGTENPDLCPEHRGQVMGFVDSLLVRKE